MILKINDLSFKYNSRNILNNVRFNVKKGEVLAILGPNGVGKTTLLKCINSILKRTKGDIYINEKNTLPMDITEIAKQMSYVAQKTDTAKLTAFDAILLGRRPHIKWRVSKEDIKKVDAVVKRLNLEHLSLKYIDQAPCVKGNHVSIGLIKTINYSKKLQENKTKQDSKSQ